MSELREWIKEKQKQIKESYPEPKNSTQIPQWLYQVNRKKADCWNELTKKTEGKKNE